MSSGQSFGVDLAIPAGGFCFLGWPPPLTRLPPIAASGVVSVLGFGRRHAVFILAGASLRRGRRCRLGAAGPAPGISAKTAWSSPSPCGFSRELLAASNLGGASFFSSSIATWLSYPSLAQAARSAPSAAPFGEFGSPHTRWMEFLVPRARRPRAWWNRLVATAWGCAQSSRCFDSLSLFRTGKNDALSRRRSISAVLSSHREGIARKRRCRRHQIGQLICCQEIRVTAEVRPTDAPRGPWDRSATYYGNRPLQSEGPCPPGQLCPQVVWHL